MPVIYSPLSDSELDSICLSLVDQDLPYFSAFHEAFVLLYLTGCRVTEIFEVARWERLNGYEMRFLPQKDNYHRYVTLDSRCDNFISAVVTRSKPFGGLSSGQLNSLFYSFSEYSCYMVGDKSVSLYLFRYNFIRRLHADGLNINQIADAMGYTSTTVVGGYLTAAIQKGFFLDTEGFVNINGTWWSTFYLNVTDGGDFIYIADVFNDGRSIGYYNRSSALRVLSSFPSFRLPSLSDFEALNVYLNSLGFYGLRSGLVPDPVYVDSVLYFMVNALGLSFYGTGRYLEPSVYNLKSTSHFVSNEGPSNSFYNVRFDFSSVSFDYYRISNYNLVPCRVILVV